MTEPETVINASADWSALHTWITPSDPKYADLDTHLIKKTFPVLQRSDQKLVLNGLVKVINLIYIKFNFHLNDKKSDSLLWNQLTQNNRQDLLSLLGFLFPFILDPPPHCPTSYDMKSKLKTLADLYTETWDNMSFKFTNSQYNRCIRYYDGTKTKYIFRPYLEDYFEQSLQLLLLSIESVANKLYVNWVDVLPYRINDFESDTLFVATQKKLNREIGSTVKLISGYIDPEPGLSLQDVYNVLTNQLYHEIKNYKWLIYDIMVDAKPKCIIRYLSQKYVLTPLFDQKQWSQITDAEQGVFTQQWGELYRSSEDIETKILNHFYFFFAKYHVNSRSLIKTGQLTLTNINLNLDEDNEDEDLIRITPETTSNAKEGLSRVPIDEIYLFFYDQISALKKSWYYYSLFDKELDYIDTTKTTNNIDIYFTHKNVYNYCKSLAHFDGKFTSFINLPKHWMSLKPDQIVTVTHRILGIPNPKDRNWFNINNYIRLLYPAIARARRTDANIFTEVTQLLTQMIRAKLTRIVFESTIYHGVLTDFRPTPTISDQNLIVSAIRTDNDKAVITYQYEQMKQTHFSPTMRELYEKHAYYYVTGTPYGELKSSTGGPYFDFLLGKQNWTFAYALNWTNQINFYHHYINNRVIYVTGAPGVGKSTQVPKLLMYGQKMIDYNSKGKVVCTQPRIAPTVNNATRIADEMGVSIVSKNRVYDKEVPTENYYIQYKHSKSQHINRSVDSFLRITTDGTLVQELKNSPFLSRTEKETKVIVSGSNEPVNWMKKIMTGNVYDIVIVDESHEHGSNMDIILTLMRDVVYVNNSIKLVIMSATMDDDEPTYRRYYRSISDNRAYPLNSAIEHMKLDRVNLDRRIHMSAPGKTSKYRVDSIFLSKTESDKINEQNYVQAGIDKTVEVVNTTKEGGILLFLAGVADITKAVVKINKKTPSNVFCLGYYGTLTDVQRKFAEDSHTCPETFTLYKEDIDKPIEQITRRVPKNTYNRAILVATNVAEASITLNSLRYIVDTGYVKINTFDVLEDNTKLITVPISWSSAVQRKGRVGRVASGTVYHLYEQKKIINNKTAYKIADEDITNILVDLIKSEPNDVSMITSINDINHIPNLECIREYKESGVVYECLQNPGVYLDMISKQYMLSEDADDNRQYYTYYGVTGGKETHTYENIMRNFREYCEKNHDDYQFQVSSEFMSRGHTGYDDIKLRDPHTTFYIVHPDENILIRDLYTGYFESLKDSVSATGAYMYYVLIHNGYTKEELDWTFKQIDAGIEVEPKVVDFYAPKCDLMFMNSAKTLQTVVVPHTMMQLDRLRLKASQYISEKFLDYYYEVDSLYPYAEYHIKSGFVGRLAELRNLADFTVLMDHNNLNWYAYTLAYDEDLANDVVGMLYLMNTFGDFSSWVENPKDLDVVTRATHINKNASGDIYFVWSIWQEIKTIIETTDILQYTKVDTTIYDQFRKMSGEFSRNQKIKFEDFVTLSRLKSAGKLGGSHDFYNYLSIYVPVFDDIVKESLIMHRIHTFTRSKQLNPDLMSKFLLNYLSVLFQLNKALWINRYEITHQLSEDIDTTTPVLDWIKKTFQFNRISELYDSELKATRKDRGWYTILETYLRAFATNTVFVDKTHYLKLSNGSRLDKLMWPGRQSFGEQTFLDKTKRSSFMVYTTTRSATMYKNNQVTYITTPSYLTNVDPHIMVRLNPVFFFIVANTRIDSVVMFLSDLSVLDRAIRYLRSKFSVSYVLDFVGNLNNPTITQYVRELLEFRA